MYPHSCPILHRFGLYAVRAFCAALCLIAITPLYALSPLPPVLFPLSIGTSGCPAPPVQTYTVVQNTVNSASIAFCATAPAQGTLNFSSSDPNASLPAPTLYDSRVLNVAPQTARPIVFRTPGQHTLRVRDSANGIDLSFPVRVNHATEVLGYECAQVAIFVPPKITVAGVGHPIAVSNCSTVAAPTPVLTFTSTDPLATLPPARAFSAGPNFGEFAGEAVFRTTGAQLLYLRNPAGELVAQATFDVRLAGGFTPCTIVPAGDCDGDGVPNAIEVQEGLNPDQKDNDVFADNTKGRRLFVLQMYRDVFKREGEFDGVNFWISVLDSGTANSVSRARMVELFLFSPESTGGRTLTPEEAVTKLYTVMLNRQPDPDGLAFWAADYRETGSLLRLSSAFIGSMEYRTRFLPTR
jgi:hypothetical protein